MNAEAQTLTPEPAPRPFSEIPELWLRLGQMTEDFFADEAAHTCAASTCVYSVRGWYVPAT